MPWQTERVRQAKAGDKQDSNICFTQHPWCTNVWYNCYHLCISNVAFLIEVVGTSNNNVVLCTEVVGTSIDVIL